MKRFRVLFTCDIITQKNVKGVFLIDIENSKLITNDYFTNYYNSINSDNISNVTINEIIETTN